MTSKTLHADRRFNIEGSDLGYPTLFHDGSTSVGMFVVSSKVANELIAESGFTVAEVAPGKAVMNFAGVHYTDTQCGTYEEVLRYSVNNIGSKTLKPIDAPVYSIFEGRPHVGYLTQHFSGAAYGRDGD